MTSTTGTVRQRQRQRRGAIAAALVSVLAAGCSSGSPAAGDPPATPMPTAERPESTATLRIASPENGQFEPRGDVPVEISLEDGEVVTETTTDLQPDEGHLHLTLDGQLVSMTSDLDAELPDVAAGTHLLRVEFVASDHAPFDPRVIQQVAFEVKG